MHQSTENLVLHCKLLGKMGESKTSRKKDHHQIIIFHILLCGTAYLETVDIKV